MKLIIHDLPYPDADKIEAFKAADVTVGGNNENSSLPRSRRSMIGGAHHR